VILAGNLLNWKEQSFDAGWVMAFGNRPALVLRGASQRMKPVQNRSRDADLWP
jgi:hypothetical protein